MRRFWSHRWVRITAGAAVLLLGSLVFVCWHYHIWSLRDLLVYQAMSRECHPVWKELHAGRVYEGQPVEEVIARTQPVRVERFENCVLLEYQEGLCFTGVTVVARDGRLVSAQAWSCTWERTFFKGWTVADEEGFWKRYWAHLEAMRQPHDPV